MKRLLSGAITKSAPTPAPNPPQDPRSQDRAARLAALTSAHATGSSVGPSPMPSPHMPSPSYMRAGPGPEVNPLEALLAQNSHIRRPGSGNLARSPTVDGIGGIGMGVGSRQPGSGDAVHPRPGSGGLARSPTAGASAAMAYDSSRQPQQQQRWPTAQEEKRAMEAELLSDALAASLRSAITPEEWRARAEASWRAQAGSSGTARTVRREERLMLEAQEFSAQAEEWRLRAEEAWERHLLERDDQTLEEMKDAQRRAKKAEGKMMDKLALLAVTEEEENEAKLATQQSQMQMSGRHQSPPDIALPPQQQQPQDEFAERRRQEDEFRRQEEERIRAEETRREHALEELARRRLAQENSAKAKRAADGRKAAKGTYQKSWDTIHHELKAYASATPFLAADRPAALHFESFPWPLYGPPPRDLSELSRDRIVEFVYDGVGGFVASTDVTAWSRPGPTPRKSYESGSGGSHSHADAPSTSPPPTGSGAAPVQPNQYHLFPEPSTSAGRAGPSHSHTNSYGSGAGASSSALPYLGSSAAGPSSGPGFTGTFNSGFNAGYAGSARPTASYAGIGAGSGNYAGVGAGATAYAGPSSANSDKYASPTGTIMLGAAPGSANYAPSGTTPPVPPPKDNPPSSYFPPVEGRRSADPHREREPPRETPRPDVSNLSRAPEDEQARRNAVKATLKLWTGAPNGKGGDKFAARLMKIIDPSSRDAVLEGHAVVVRTLLSELVSLD